MELLYIYIIYILLIALKEGNEEGHVFKKNMFVLFVIKKT